MAWERGWRYVPAGVGERQASCPGRTGSPAEPRSRRHLGLHGDSARGTKPTCTRAFLDRANQHVRASHRPPPSSSLSLSLFLTAGLYGPRRGDTAACAVPCRPRVKEWRWGRTTCPHWRSTCLRPGEWPRAKLKVSVGLHLPAPWPERATHLSPKIYATTRHLAETENEITRLFTWQPCRRIRRVHCTRPQIYGVRRSMQFLVLRIWGIPRDHPQKEKQGPCAVLVHV